MTVLLLVVVVVVVVQAPASASLPLAVGRLYITKLAYDRLARKLGIPPGRTWRVLPPSLDYRLDQC